jgi:hypothetical protein
MILSMRDKLDYLTHATGCSETEIIAEAIEEGLSELYRKQIINLYLSGELDKEKAVEALGTETIEELDYARKLIPNKPEIKKGTAEAVLEVFGKWTGDDSEEIIDLIYSTRSKAEF